MAGSWSLRSRSRCREARMMGSATKFAAGYGADNLPDLALAQRELGDQTSAIKYRDLIRRYPNVEIGPDQSFAEHFKRLKEAEQASKSQDTGASALQQMRDKGKISPTTTHEEVLKAGPGDTKSWFDQ